LLEARLELQPSLSKSQSRLKDLIFLDVALDSTVRTAVERGYEELNNAAPEVIPCFWGVTVFKCCLLNFVVLIHILNQILLYTGVWTLQKIMYFIILVLENLALSSDDNEDLIYCLKV